MKHLLGSSSSEHEAKAILKMTVGTETNKEIVQGLFESNNWDGLKAADSWKGINHHQSMV